MGVTTYYSADGELLGHRTDVGAAYGTDALGSVTVTAIENQQRTPTNYYYKPYGSRLNKLGNNADPRYLWNGTSGYRETAISHSKSYVQARHLGQEEGRWTTVDPLWPGEQSYGYVRSRPSVMVDPSGMAYRDGLVAWPDLSFAFFCSSVGNGFTASQISQIDACITNSGGSDKGCPKLSDPISPGSKVSFAGCLPFLCKPGQVDLKFNDPSICCPPNPPGAKSWRGSTGPCHVVICSNQFGKPGANDVGGDESMPAGMFNLLHELAHCCGGSNHGTGKSWEECQDIMACCIFQIIFRKPPNPNKCKRHKP